MPTPKNVSDLKFFLGQLQFYSKFLQNISTVAKPLFRLTRKNISWQWGAEEETASIELLCADTVLTPFGQSLPVGTSCGASNVGIGAVLFHRMEANALLQMSQRHSLQHREITARKNKEASHIIFALSKFHLFLSGRPFILVTDHKPLLIIFSPTKATPALAANRLAKWALTLSQYDYVIEYRKTSEDGNTDAPSHLPNGPDKKFDIGEDEADTDTMCAIRFISSHLQPHNPNILRKETRKDVALSTAQRYYREGWPVYIYIYIYIYIYMKPNRHIKQTQHQIYISKMTSALLKKSKTLLAVKMVFCYMVFRVVIHQSLRKETLMMLHLGHLGIERMKQLVVYWSGIDKNIYDLCKSCDSCCGHQNNPSKAPVHPWMFPEKPWSRIHIDHAINFMISNWLIIIDAFSKYPCIHPTQSISSKTTIKPLEPNFVHC